MAFRRLSATAARRARLIIAIGVLAAAGATGACRGPARPHEALRAGAEPLRSHFNRDAGRVRVVILAAPT
jgi:hypothetical protein